MIITENIHPLTEERNYTIKIEQTDDIEATEIGECFKLQYPKDIAVITFAKIIQMDVGLLIVGLNLKNMKKNRNV